MSIGFLGGPVLSARVSPSELGRLREQLGNGRWFELMAEDGVVALDLEKVVYVLVDTDDHRVGFGT